MIRRDIRFSIGWMMTVTLMTAILFGVADLSGLTARETLLGIAAIVSIVSFFVLLIEILSRGNL